MVVENDSRAENFFSPSKYLPSPLSHSLSIKSSETPFDNCSDIRRLVIEEWNEEFEVITSQRLVNSPTRLQRSESKRDLPPICAVFTIFSTGIIGLIILSVYSSQVIYQGK